MKAVKTLIPILFVALFLNAINSNAQVYNVLHNFGGQNHDGYAPLTDLVLGSNMLYGTTASGGTNGGGIIFKVNTDGNGYGIIRSLTNSDSISGGMVLIGYTLYGTTYTGGSAHGGSVFKINTDGSGFTVLHNFADTMPSFPGTNSDGNRPQGDLVTRMAACFTERLNMVARMPTALFSKSIRTVGIYGHQIIFSHIPRHKQRQQ